MKMKSLSVRGVRIDRISNTPVVTLREEDAPRRQFEIFIGAPEAAAIKTALDDEQTPRPLTHDLFVLALERVSVSVSRVVLTHVSNGTYYADLVLTPDGGNADTVPSGKAGLGLSLTEALGAYGEVSFVGSGDEDLDRGYGAKLGVKYSF